MKLAILRALVLSFVLAVAGVGSLSYAAPPSGTAGSGSPIFTFSNGSDLYTTSYPILEGSLLGTFDSPTSGTITGFEGTLTINGTPYAASNPFSAGGASAFTGSSGNYAVDGFNFSVSDGSNTWLYSSLAFSGTGQAVSFTVTRVGGGVQPTTQLYNVTSVPEIDGAILPRAAAILGGFAMLILLGARQRVYPVSSDG